MTTLISEVYNLHKEVGRICEESYIAFNTQQDLRVSILI